MILTLEVTGSQAAKLGNARRKTFNATGGTIGRLPSNYWSLPDPYVSSRHAIIRYEGGAFYIEDTSTNGVFINRADNRLVKGQPYALKSNDLILIEPYEIRATIEAGAAAAPPTLSGDDDLFSFPSRPHAGASSASPHVGGPLIPSEDLAQSHDELDPLKLLGGGGEAKARPQQAPSADNLRAGSVLDQHFRPPAVIPPAPLNPPASAPARGLIPSDYDPFADERHSPPTPPSSVSLGPIVARPEPVPVLPADDDWLLPTPAPNPEPAPERPAPAEPAVQPVRPRRAPVAARSAPPAPEPEPDRTDPLSLVLRGAGIDPAALTPELAEDFGRILRLVVGGVMDVLQARQRIKSEFRMDMTVFRPSDNNPLKFSANVDDALHNLLVKRNAAFLNPVDAFDDAFDDIRNHQVAMLAGMRVAFEAMLAHFDPERLQQEFDRQMKHGSLISVPAKMRYWDLYGVRFRDMVKDADAAFRELFGDEFAAAYEEQLKRLKSRSRDNEQ